MSRLTADQESRGIDGDPGVGTKGSVMRVNLTEGCRPVNDGTSGEMKLPAAAYSAEAATSATKAGSYEIFGERE